MSASPSLSVGRPRQRFLASFLLLLGLGSMAGQAPAAQAEDAPPLPAGREVHTRATDGGPVVAQLYEEGLHGRWILLFHQARGDGRGEYVHILPRLLARGHRVLCVDQRSGGDLFGQVNRTVAARKDEELPGYCAAYPDLVGALRWLLGHDPQARPFVWGSSYSAALVLRLAAEFPEEIAGVLAFSPAEGGPLKECPPGPAAEALAELGVPVLIARPESELEHPSVRKQFERFGELGFVRVVGHPGRHGSSMLDPERAGKGAEQTFEEVEAFLDVIAQVRTAE